MALPLGSDDQEVNNGWGGEEAFLFQITVFCPPWASLYFTEVMDPSLERGTCRQNSARIFMHINPEGPWHSGWVFPQSF